MGPHAHVGRSFQSETISSSAAKSRWPVLVGELQVQPVAFAVASSSRSSSWKITSSADGAEWMCTMSGVLAAGVQRPQHRHDGRDATTRGDEQQLGRWRVGQREIALGRSQANDRSGFHTVHQVRGQEAFGRRLDGDRDELLVAHGNRSQRVGPPVPLAVDAQTDADVLPRLVVTGESPPGLDGHGRRVFGLSAARRRPRRAVRGPTTAD